MQSGKTLGFNNEYTKNPLSGVDFPQRGTGTPPAGPNDYFGQLLQLAPGVGYLPWVDWGSYSNFQQDTRKKLGYIEKAQIFAQKKQALELQAMKEEIANRQAQRAALRKPRGAVIVDAGYSDKIREMTNAARDREYLEKRRALELEAMKKQMEMANMMREINTTNKTLGTGFDTQVVNDAGMWRTINLPWEKKLEEEQRQTTNNTYGNIG